MAPLSPFRIGSDIFPDMKEGCVSIEHWLKSRYQDASTLSQVLFFNGLVLCLIMDHPMLITGGFELQTPYILFSYLNATLP